MGILNDLTQSLLSKPLPHSLCEFLASMTENDAMYPNGHLTAFEIKRLQFTHYATTKYQFLIILYFKLSTRNMTEAKSKMLIGSHLLLRTLLCNLIMRPWEVLPSLKRKRFESNRIR